MADDTRRESPIRRSFAFINAYAAGISAVAALLIPIVVGFLGYMINSTVSQREVEAQYVNMAIAILSSSEEPSSDDRALRAYAVDLLVTSSPVSIDEDLQQQLVNGEAEISDLASIMAREAAASARFLRLFEKYLTGSMGARPSESPSASP